MLESVVLRCRPGAQFHFGRIATDVDTSLHDTSIMLASDALVSALAEVASRVFPKEMFEETLLGLRSGIVRYSSLCYCLETNDGSFVYFLPKPVSLDTFDPPDNDSPECARDRKMILRVRFISKGVWEQGIVPAEWTDKCILLPGGFLATKSELKSIPATVWDKIKLFDFTSLPKVAVHKATREDSLYFLANIQLPDFSNLEGLEKTSVHFFYLMDSTEDVSRSRSHTLAQILADEGIGGERSTGCGRLENCMLPQSFEIVPAKNLLDRFCSISLLSPAGQDELDECLAYKVETRAGRRTAEHGYLKRLKMVTEGAVLRTSVKGKTHDISPDADGRYLRFGNALCLPLHDNFDLKQDDN